MTKANPQERWAVYQDAWADIADADRERLVRSSVADEIHFSNPDDEGHGIQDLLKLIAGFQTQFPGAYFRTERILVQHGQLLAEWTMLNKDGSAFLTAHSYARFDDAGRFTQLAGFWKL